MTPPVSLSPDQPKKIAIYPGTFDPITNGHLDIIRRGRKLFDQIIITLARNPDKKSLFSLEERIALIQACFSPKEDGIEVDVIDGLVVEYAVNNQANAIIRGLRAVSDFDYEFQLALMNRSMERRVETVFLMTGFRWIYISSSIIKDAARHGGNIKELVPSHVHTALEQKFRPSL